ncbi:MAG TPA: heavy-metal-associated domain-containing protein [Thiobacillus sp.]|nr:MAG: hypothetical protein B7Y50_08995 [Hydrogenophilales bacterium 28-61-11]OYZ57136.1 MAG: hypothetical protein B7Y21_08715 [Hydrogenophilales bacterium 16-61-112]OZA47319.1 MAG: hypothetical protein B7X81_05510 [Hydrogenophilales bacterium 17-61-76]HQT31198.1 heavy-metal-associated domain-containing protein [Thiobacillus sp.]HQT71098.1 heavy-metal-associated domain-containing protein [Thiobacillus sp.]
MNTLQLNITGMTCGGCVNSVQNVLAALPGVESVQVTLDPGLAKVVYDSSRIAPAALQQAVIDAGFGATL